MNEGVLSEMLNDNLFFSIALGYTALGFSFYYFLSKRYRPAKIHRFFKEEPGAQAMLVQRLYGLFFMGIVPLLLILFLPDKQPDSYGLEFEFSPSPPAWVWILFPLIPLVASFTARSDNIQSMYPQMRFRKWTTGRLLLSGVSWSVFILGYEFLFRGFLLFASLKVMDPLAAIVLNTALYSLAHMYKGPGETFGSIPVGFLFCYLSMHTGNIGLAVLLHITMALSNEFFALRANPEMTISRSK